MTKDIFLVNQAKLFNNNLSEEQIDYIIKNNLLIYGNINENQNHEFLINENYAIEEITWFYDNNNCKINKIKYDEKSTIFDYISSGSLIDNENIICGENFLKISDVFIGSINSINANPNNSHFSKKIINIETIENNNYENLRENNIIFVKTDDLWNFYHKTNNENIKNKIIITHNSDIEINTEHACLLEKIKKQYSQNCLIKHPNLEPIPIGIENKQWFDHEVLHQIRIRNDIKKRRKYIFTSV